MSAGAAPSSTVVRFGPFRFDQATGELRKGATVLRLQDQPSRLLGVLLERPGELVTRERIRDLLWPGVSIEYDYALNTAIRKIRAVLLDSADQPKYVETVPKRGYRFIAKLDTEPVHLAGSEPSPKIPAPAPVAVTPSRKPVLRVLAVAATALIVAGGYRIVTRVPVLRVDSYRQMTSDGAEKRDLLGGQGATLYVTEKTGILSLPVSGGPATLVPNSAALTPVAISPSGNELLVLNGVGRVEEDRPLGILAVPSAEYRSLPFNGHAGAWSPDGARIAYAKDNDLFSSRPDGTDSRRLASPGRFARYMRWSPDGRSLIFALEQGTTDHQSLWRISSDGTGLREVVDHGTTGGWLPDGSAVVVAAGSPAASELQVVPLHGKPYPLTRGVPGFTFPTFGSQGDLFAIAYMYRGQLVRLDPASGHFVPFLNGVSADGVAFSRDGQWVAWSAWPERTIWRSRADGSDRRQLSFAPEKGVSPRWSRDGTTIAFTDMPSDPSGHTRVMLVSRDGGAATEADAKGEEIALATWSPEGLLAAGAAAWLHHWSPDSTIRIVDPGKHSVSVIPGSRGYWAPKWSPDGQYIWAEHVNSHQFALLDRRTGLWGPPIEAGGVIGYGAWSHDSRFVWFNLSGDGTVFRVAAKGGRPEKIMTVRDFETANTLGQWFGLAPDDSPLLLRDTSVNEIFELKLARERPFP